MKNFANTSKKSMENRNWAFSAIFHKKTYGFFVHDCSYDIPWLFSNSIYQHLLNLSNNIVRRISKLWNILLAFNHMIGILLWSHRINVKKFLYSVSKKVYPVLLSFFSSWWCSVCSSLSLFPLSNAFLSTSEVFQPTFDEGFHLLSTSFKNVIAFACNAKSLQLRL